MTYTVKVQNLKSNNEKRDSNLQNPERGYTSEPKPRGYTSEPKPIQIYRGKKVKESHIRHFQESLKFQIKNKQTSIN